MESRTEARMTAASELIYLHSAAGTELRPTDRRAESAARAGGRALKWEKKRAIERPRRVPVLSTATTEGYCERAVQKGGAKECCLYRQSYRC